jgi:hypothetical protein
MAGLLDEIHINYTDKEINNMLNADSGMSSSITRHFSQNEEFFIKLKESFFVPSFPIHHDVTVPTPTTRYLETLKVFLTGVVPLVQKVFGGLTYFFDPTDILRPGFFQLYKMADMHYLYVLKVDLTYRTNDHSLIQRGTNDSTAEYRSNKLFLEGTTIPIAAVQKLDNKVSSFRVHQTISRTWIGERGSRYMVQGIWIDNDLTKFFSKLFVPAKKRVYPYYPFQCKYKTICQGVIDLDFESRKALAPYLHKALEFVAPVMGRIESSLSGSGFSLDLPEFGELKKAVPSYWSDLWNGIAVRAYLNEQDMKEYIIEDHT